MELIPPPGKVGAAEAEMAMRGLVLWANVTVGRVKCFPRMYVTPPPQQGLLSTVRRAISGCPVGWAIAS